MSKYVNTYNIRIMIRRRTQIVEAYGEVLITICSVDANKLACRQAGRYRWLKSQETWQQRKYNDLTAD